MKCIECGKKLTGRQRKYCSKRCGFRNYNATPERKKKEHENYLKSRLPVACDGCGVLISRSKYPIKQSGKHYCKQCHNKRRNNPRWKGGKIKDGDGYVKVLFPKHHRSHQDGYVLEHLIVMERKIGRELKEYEVVHHINGDKGDNRPDNLQLTTKKEHLRMHFAKHKDGNGWYPISLCIGKVGKDIHYRMHFPKLLMEECPLRGDLKIKFDGEQLLIRKK